MDTFKEQAISISIHPHIFSYKNMEKEGIYDILIELFKKIAHRFVISKEHGKHSKEYTHYQIYIWKPNIKINGVRQSLDRLLKPYLKKGEELQKGKNKIWMKVKNWNPKEDDIIQSSKYGLGYCLKEGGQSWTNFALVDIHMGTMYYEVMNKKIEEAKAPINNKDCYRKNLDGTYTKRQYCICGICNYINYGTNFSSQKMKGKYEEWIPPGKIKYQIPVHKGNLPRRFAPFRGGGDF